MEAVIIQQVPIKDEISIISAKKIASVKVKEAIQVINRAIGWSDEDEEIFIFLERHPELIYLAHLNESMVGYIVLREEALYADKHLHISWIATNRLNQGIGTLLMHRAFQKNKKLGYRLLTLHFRTDHIYLRAFYEKIARLEAVQCLCEAMDSVYSRITYVQMDDGR